MRLQCSMFLRLYIPETPTSRKSIDPLSSVRFWRSIINDGDVSRTRIFLTEEHSSILTLRPQLVSGQPYSMCCFLLKPTITFYSFSKTFSFTCTFHFNPIFSKIDLSANKYSPCLDCLHLSPGLCVPRCVTVSTVLKPSWTIICFVSIRCCMLYSVLWKQALSSCSFGLFCFS